MKKNNAKSLALKTVKVSGAAVSLAWAAVVVAVSISTLLTKTDRLVEEFRS